MRYLQPWDRLLEECRGLKKNTLESAIFTVLDEFCAEHENALKAKSPDEVLETFEVASKGIYDRVRVELDGTYKDEAKDQSFETPEHGKVSHKKISQICTDRFGAELKPDRKQRMLVFSKERLDKVREAYSFSGDDDGSVQITPRQPAR